MTDETKALVEDLMCVDRAGVFHSRRPKHTHPVCHKAADRIEALEAEVERLRKLTRATWFYMPDEGDRCWFSPHEVIDEMYDPEPGNHVFEVECATSLPSIWCAVRVTDDPDADERFTFTEHDTEAEARAALGEKQ